MADNMVGDGEDAPTQVVGNGSSATSPLGSSVFCDPAASLTASGIADGATLSSSTFGNLLGADGTAPSGSTLTIAPMILYFPPPLNRIITNLVKLHNNNKTQYVAYKVKTTRPNRYCVRPNLGLIAPDDTIELQIHFSFQKDPPTSLRTKDKFQVESIVFNSPVKPDQPIAELFKTTPKDKIETQKLKSRFSAPIPVRAPERHIANLPINLPPPPTKPQQPQQQLRSRSSSSSSSSSLSSSGGSSAGASAAAQRPASSTATHRSLRVLTSATPPLQAAAGCSAFGLVGLALGHMGFVWLAFFILFVLTGAVYWFTTASTRRR
eukprot:TRINITY_DN2961_c0_g1_i1.p1 TRINITY_DN2961_c0_g1~~TRINITY_DN2961_c0_g1_i1.p1  ORF type:complete len:344 (+),score=55.90 TRINITY_DN2961_c0_g1_i1:68-1033(+)